MIEIKAIEFQFFNGCPNADSTLENLREVMSELDINSKILKLTEVPDLESAENLNFQGSPTILLDGKDVYTGGEPKSYSYSCRIYTFGDSQTGVIPKDYIKEKLTKELIVPPRV